MYSVKAGLFLLLIFLIPYYFCQPVKTVTELVHPRNPIDGGRPAWVLQYARILEPVRTNDSSDDPYQTYYVLGTQITLTLASLAQSS